MKLKLITMITATMISFFAFADWVSDELIERAASSWLLSDRVAQLTMKGLSFDRLVHRGSLRVVHLSPSGYIVMSGSDIADPVISFSRNNFVEPEEGSPFHAMLKHSDSDVSKHEEVGGVRATKWTELIGNHDGSKSSARRLMTAEEGLESSAILVEPFMKTHWNQWQPYNDFSAVGNPDVDDQLYRARVACGCVATATAQQVAYFRWPWYLGGSICCNYMVNRTGEDEPFSMRFDGHVPFDWDALLDTYSWWWGDARGRVAESERYPISRLIMWSDVILGSGGYRGSFHNTRDSAADWYEKCEEYSLKDYSANTVAKIKADLETATPVHVWILEPYHAVVAHGFASDGESHYLYLNYGWGGSNDGWYKLYDSPMVCAFVGFRPKKMVQLEPLPTVSEGNIEIKWHLPHCHSNTVRRFEILTKEFGSEVGNETCDFTHAVGIPSNPKAAYVTNNVVQIDGDVDFVCENETDFLWWGSYASGMYDLPGEHLLTGTSVLSYRTQSADVGDREVEILASFDGGEWQTVSIPLLNRRVWSKSWITQSVFLGQHAGKMARFRIKVGWGGGRLFFDDFKVANVILPSVVSRACAPSMRSCPLSGLGAGKWVGVMVTPLFDEGSGQVSECQYTRLAGNANLPIPEEVSIYRTNDVNYISAEAGNSWSLRGFAEGERTIRAHHAWMGGFDVSLPGMITEQSVLSFSWYETGYYGSGTEYDVITAVFIDNCGEETTVWDMTNTVQLAERQFVEIPLACVAGKAGGIKVMFWHNGANWAGENDVMRFYSPMISNIAVPVIPEARWERKTFTALPLPRIDSIKGRDGLEIDEGLYREIGIGEDWLRVTCSETVTSLRAYPSHLSLMDDDDVTVEKITDGEFLVRMNTSKVVRRSRMILTLAAADSNGTTAYRDLSLRFDSPSEVLKTDRMRKQACLAADTKPIAAFQFENNMDNSGTGALISSIGGGGVSYVESPLGYALHHDDLDGPCSGSAFDFPNDWTILTVAKFSETDNAVLFQFGSSGYEQSGFALASGGRNVVTLSHWMPHTQHTDIISVNVSDASAQYHAYALRGHGRNIELFVDGVMAGSATLQTLPEVGFQFFSVIQGAGDTGLTNAAGEHVDDWRMYDVALPDTAIVAYANTLLMFDQEKAGVEVGDVVVPERWFKKYYPSGTMSRSALSAKAANGRSAWECYVAGLDPTDEDDDLVADITFEGGVPKVSIANGEKSNRMYRILATKTLDNAEAPLDVTDVPDLSAEPYWDYRFFRISAELP